MVLINLEYCVKCNNKNDIFVPRTLFSYSVFFGCEEKSGRHLIRLRDNNST